LADGQLRPTGQLQEARPRDTTHRASPRDASLVRMHLAEHSPMCYSLVRRTSAVSGCVRSCRAAVHLLTHSSLMPAHARLKRSTAREVDNVSGPLLRAATLAVRGTACGSAPTPDGARDQCGSGMPGSTAGRGRGKRPSEDWSANTVYAALHLPGWR